MIVYIDYDIHKGHWIYYTYDSDNYKSIVCGFKTHIIAKSHATGFFKGKEITFIHKELV